MPAARLLRGLRAAGHALVGSNRRARARLDGTRAAVLNYHRVIPDEQARRECVEEGMHVRPETFARHLAWLDEYFTVLPLHEIVERIAASRPLPEGACAITFDDGWRDNLEHALPALATRRMPATLFVVSERIGTLGAFWPDEVLRRMSRLDDAAAAEVAGVFASDGPGDPAHRVIVALKTLAPARLDEALERLRGLCPEGYAEAQELLDWSELDTLAAGGVDVEVHGASHAILTNLSDEAVRWELETAREHLRERGHARHGLLAYPVGENGPRERALADELGYRAAFTIIRGLASAEGDRLALPRLMIHEQMSATRNEFLLKVPGWD